MSSPEEITFLAKGAILGFSVAAPVGPIGLLCIRRSLAQGAHAGLVSGLGAATADAAYGCIAAFGLKVVTEALVRQAHWMQLIGGVFLVGLGASILRSRPPTNAATPPAGGLGRMYASTLLLTISNPLTILSFAAMFAGLGLSGAQGRLTAAAMVLGVFLGSGAWWMFLSLGVSRLRERVTPSTMAWVNQCSGLAIMVFGLVALAFHHQ